MSAREANSNSVVALQYDTNLEYERWMRMQTSYKDEEVVKDLLYVLDKLDEMEKCLKYHKELVAFCHLALIDKNNDRLLPFVSILTRYGDKGYKYQAAMLQEMYYKLNSYYAKRY